MMSGKELIEVGGHSAKNQWDSAGPLQVQANSRRCTLNWGQNWRGKLNLYLSIYIYPWHTRSDTLNPFFFVFRTLSIVSTLNSYREDLD